MLSLEPRPELLQDIFLEANYFQSPEPHVSCYHYYHYCSNSKTTSSDDDKLKNLSAAAVHTQKFEPNHKMLLQGYFKAIWFKVYVYKSAQKRKYIIKKKKKIEYKEYWEPIRSLAFIT